MAVSEQTPYKEYTANGSTNSFSLEFDCENQDHLIVLVDDVEPVVGTWSLIGSAVVFGTAPINGKKITIQRNTPFRRDGDFQSYDNSFRPAPVNKGFDKTWWKIQELGVADWLLGLKLQKFRDDVNLTALENTLEEAKQIRDETADSVIEVQSNVDQSQALLASTTAQSNLAQGYASSANSANAAAQQVAIDVSDAESNVYLSLSAQQVEVNNSLTAIAGGHKAYQTLVAAQAAQASLPTNTVVEVTNDGANNGTYQWDGTILTKSAYDPLAQAKADATTKANTAKSEANDYTNQKTKNVGSAGFDTALFMKVDANDNVVEYTDEQGGLHLVGLDSTVQENFTELEDAKAVTSVNRTTVTHIFSDNNENVIAYLKSDGNLVLIGIDGSVQSEFAKLNLSDDQLREKTKSLEASNLDDVTHIFSDSAENVVAYIKKDGGLYLVGIIGSLQSNITSLTNRATTLENDLQKLRDEVSVDEILIEKELVPQNYSVDADQILTIKCDYPDNIQGFFPDSPYRQSDSPTHPCVIELAKPLRGYKYLMVQTPYYENHPEEENPCVYGSNDMNTWLMLEDIPQPLDETPTWDEALEGKKGYLSDCWWTYDHITKELYCCYRKAYTVGENTYNPTDIMQLLYRKTSNGIHWTKPQKLFGDVQNSVDPIISPAIIYDFKNHIWCMFYFKSGRGFAMRTNSDFRNPNTWSEPIDLGYEAWVGANNPLQQGWHLDVRYIGDRLFAMINDSTNAKLYMAYADKDDLTQWTFTSNSVLRSPPPRNSCYKGSFIAVPVDATQIKMHVVWTDAGGYRRLYNAKTFPISIF